LLPYQRIADALDELAGIAISPGTIHGTVGVAATCLEAQVQAICGALVKARVAHADEFGVRVAGGLYWLHVLSTAPWRGAYASPRSPRVPGNQPGRERLIQIPRRQNSAYHPQRFPKTAR